MPLTKKQRSTLSRLLKAHSIDVTEMRTRREWLASEIERRESGVWPDPNPKPVGGIEVLRDQLKEIDLEIERHGALIALGQNDRLLATLDELVDHPELVKRAIKDPKKYAAGRKIELPSTMELSLAVVDDYPRLTVTNYDRLAVFTLVWDREGFTVGS